MRLIKRFIAYWRVRSIELDLAGKQERLSETREPIARANIEHAIHLLRKRLAKARSDYRALFPPGVRMTWRQA